MRTATHAPSADNHDPVSDFLRPPLRVILELFSGMPVAESSLAKRQFAAFVPKSHRQTYLQLARQSDSHSQQPSRRLPTAQEVEDLFA